MRKVTKKIKEVNIGGEQIEAEYLIFEYNYSSKENKFSNLWYKITIPYYRTKIKIKDIYWKTKYGFQRMFKGYDSVDIFDISGKFIDRYYKILTEYKKNMHGYPGTMSEEEWNNIIDKMLFHLYYMDEKNIEKELYKDVPENWTLSLQTTDLITEKHKNEFFKLFAEHFYSLWD